MSVNYFAEFSDGSPYVVLYDGKTHRTHLQTTSGGKNGCPEPMERGRVHQVRLWLPARAGFALRRLVRQRPLYFDEFQCPNWFFWDIRALGVSSDNEERRAKKETCEYTSRHGFTSASARRTSSTKKFS